MASSLRVGDLIAVNLTDGVGATKKRKSVSGTIMAADDHGLRLKDSENGDLLFVPWSLIGFSVIVEEAPAPRRGITGV
jgi:hypothetical protein